MALTEGYFTSEPPSVITLIDLLATASFVFNAVCVAVETGLLASDVLSTLGNPTIVLSIPETVPVKVGEAILAFKANPGTVGAPAVPAKSPAN